MRQPDLATRRTMSRAIDAWPRVDVLGIGITSCTTDAVADVITAAVAGALPPQHLATVNLDFLARADQDEALRATLMRTSHCFADGWPVLSLAKRAGTPLPERVTGADLVPAIFAWARERGWRIGVVGGTEATRDALAAHPDADLVAGHWLPDYRASGNQLADPALAADIAAAEVDVLLVALGCPRQERWIQANLHETGAATAIGIGAAIDFHVGVRSRAPRWIQRLRGEFFYRMLCEPRRLVRRYWHDLVFLALVRLGIRGRHAQTAGTYTVDPGAATRVNRHAVGSTALVTARQA